MKNDNQFAHYLIKRMLYGVLHVFWLCPVKKNRITLLNELSFSYGDNLKYLQLYIEKNLPGKYEIVFPIKDLSKEHPDTVITVKPLSFKYFYYLLTSGSIVTNAGGVSYLPIRHGKQTIVNTWHGGGPYKKTGTLVYQDKWYRKESEMQVKNVTYLLSSCRYFTDYEAPGQLYPKSKCIPSGMPRNDIFFHDADLSELKKKVYDYYKIPPDIKLILFAPTYRGNVDDHSSSEKYGLMGIDNQGVVKALEKRFGGKWTFAARLHPKLLSIEFSDKSIVNMTAYPDMQELLAAADVVITDYSSLMWDFSFTYRPCLLYANDIEEYEKTRGFYMPVSKWPFPLAHDNKELIKNIENFNREKYVADVKRHHTESGSYETGEACKKTMELIGLE